MRTSRWLQVLVVVMVGTVVYFAAVRDASAIPSFARKYQTSCLTCHTVISLALNPFGEAFRRNGYRFSEPGRQRRQRCRQGKRDRVMGQEEYTKTFFELGVARQDRRGDSSVGHVQWQHPHELSEFDAKAAAGNVFTWSGIEAEFHGIRAGAFNDSLTYFTQLTWPTAGRSTSKPHTSCGNPHRRPALRGKSLGRPVFSPRRRAWPV